MRSGGSFKPQTPNFQLPKIRLWALRANGQGTSRIPPRVREALDHKYAAFRTEGGDRNVDDVVMALIEITPDERILTWDNTA